ncbi:hypothetical protein THRCLA_03701 [Thraustotheca clavata]|uniref:Uncharacterized protein n=1 Tax=Thraustotheca clavata TaxID=74557 RepID=A0A1W0A178_9STRA|nr:hypothetical protein THRCLA_03701 [Thraustotheca clavata]
MLQNSPDKSEEDRAGNGGKWSREEHERFLVGIQTHPHGPWKKVAAIVKTRTTRQTQTHAQKFRQKLDRQERALRTNQAFENRDVYLPFPFTSTPSDTSSATSTPKASLPTTSDELCWKIPTSLPPLAEALDSLIALLEEDNNDVD